MHVPHALAPYARTLVVSGVRLFAYDTGGPSDPLLLVHGLGDEADTWRRVIGPLSRRYRVVAPDLPGFGRSGFPSRGGFAPERVATLLAGLLESLGIRRATLLGSSLGASLAQLAALARPGLAERLILVDGALAARPRFRARALAMLVPGAVKVRFRRLSRHPDAAYESLRPYYADLDGLPPEERDFLRARVCERVASATQTAAYAATVRSLARWRLVSGRRHAERAAGIRAPSLYLWGAQDRIIPPAAGEEAARAQPGARFEVVAGAGHLPHQERPAEFVRIVLGAGS